MLVDDDIICVTIDSSVSTMNRKFQVTGLNLFMVLTDNQYTSDDVTSGVFIFLALFIVMECPTKTWSRIIIPFHVLFKAIISGIMCSFFNLKVN